MAFTFVNAALTLLTPVFIVLLAFRLTLLTALLTFVSTEIGHDHRDGDAKMSETKRTRNISFRLTDEDYKQIENIAEASGEDPNTWCRKTALEHSQEGHTFTKNERLIYQEIALLRFLIGHGFKLLFSKSETTAATWKTLTAQADQQSEKIVEELLSRRK